MIDFERDYVVVGGRPPLAYMQDGHGYDAGGHHLGRVNDQGEMLEEGESQDDHSERADLEHEAASLGVTYRSNISTESLRARVEKAREEAEY